MFLSDRAFIHVIGYGTRSIASEVRNSSSTMSSPKSPSASTSAPDLDILGDQITIHRSGYVKPPSPQDANPEQNLVEHMARFRESPLDFLREVSLHVSGAGWRAYDNSIGQPIYYSGFTENMKAMVLRTPMLRRRIEDLATNRAEVEQKQGLLGEGEERVKRVAQRQEDIRMSLQEVATDLTDRMIFKPESKRFIRGAYYVCTQLLTRAYHQGTTDVVSYLSFLFTGLSQVFTSPVRRSFVYDRSQKKQQRRNTLLSFYHVIDHMSITFQCKLYAFA